MTFTLKEEFPWFPQEFPFLISINYLAFATGSQLTKPMNHLFVLVFHWNIILYSWKGYFAFNIEIKYPN